MSRISTSLCTFAAVSMMFLCCLAAEAQDKVIQITLPEAQEKASSPLARAAQLTVDSARYHRQAAVADYFPKIGSTFVNMHFNKLMGEHIQLAKQEVTVPLMNKDQSIVAVTVAQPVTPLLKVREAVN